MLTNKEGKGLKDFEAEFGNTYLGLGVEDFVDEAADLFQSSEDSDEDGESEEASESEEGSDESSS